MHCKTSSKLFNPLYYYFRNSPGINALKTKKPRWVYIRRFDGVKSSISIYVKLSPVRFGAGLFSVLCKCRCRNQIRQIAAPTFTNSNSSIFIFLFTWYNKCLLTRLIIHCVTKHIMFCKLYYGIVYVFFTVVVIHYVLS